MSNKSDKPTLDSAYIHLYNGGTSITLRKESEELLGLEVSNSFFGKSSGSIFATLSSEQLEEIGTMFMEVAKNFPTKKEELAKP